jgi:hypothetical protein
VNLQTATFFYWDHGCLGFCQAAGMKVVETPPSSIGRRKLLSLLSTWNKLEHDLGADGM